MEGLQQLNMTIDSFIEVNDIVFPIRVDIADISDYKLHSERLKIDIDANGVTIDETTNPYENYLKDYNDKKDLRYYLSFIDNRPFIEGGTFKEKILGIDNNEDMLDRLDELGFTDVHLVRLKNHIGLYIQNIKNKCRSKIIEILDYDRDFPKIKLKEDKMKPYKEYMSYPKQMSILQTAMEYTNSILFPENKGRSFFEFSFREIQLKVLYISMKSKIENFTNTAQAKTMERDDK